MQFNLIKNNNPKMFTTKKGRHANVQSINLKNIHYQLPKIPVSLRGETSCERLVFLRFFRADFEAVGEVGSFIAVVAVFVFITVNITLSLVDNAPICIAFWANCLVAVATPLFKTLALAETFEIVETTDSNFVDEKLI